MMPAPRRQARPRSRGAPRLAPWAALTFGLLLLPHAAQATACADFARGGSGWRPACPLAPQPLRALRVDGGSARYALLGPVRTVELAPRMRGAQPVISGALENKRSTFESDLAESDCHGSLCGPQSDTLRVGRLYLEHQGTFSPMIGGLVAVIGGIALNLKPGPRLEAAPGPSLDGWAAASKGLKPAGPPFAFLPLISINNREGGMRFVLSW